MKLNPTLLALAAVCSATILPAAVQAQNAAKVGTLSCSVSAGLGLVITSSRDMDCVFQPSGGRKEAYRGTIRRYGIDIGTTTRGTLVRGVNASLDAPIKATFYGGGAEGYTDYHAMAKADA
jgi:hypothetical protein